MDMDITVQNFGSLLPKGRKFNVTQQFVDDVNGCIKDEEVREQFRENMLSYTDVLTQGRFRLDQYVNAVKYVSFKMFGNTNVLAYQKAFPDKYNQWIVDGKGANEINSYVSAFHNSQLVMKIFAQAAIPTHLLNAHLFQKAINTQAEIMADDDVSPKVRSDAANSLLTHLKPPEAKKIEIDIGASEGTVSAIDELKQVTEALAKQQMASLQSGTLTAKQVAHSSIRPNEKVINP